MKKALVVDDSEFMGRLVEIFLHKHGWEVDVCNGPFGVLNRVREYLPDVLLLDLNMPGLSGDKLAEILKERMNSYNIKTISFSTEDEKVQKGLVEKGLIDGYFVKGSTFNGLCEEIDRVLYEEAA